MDYFLQIYGTLPRAGPGADDLTRGAFALMTEVPDSPRILDVGCGPGNSTQVLQERFGESEIIGLDSSEEMIHKARGQFPEGSWVCADAAEYDYGGDLDVIFSNAVLQWIADQRPLIDRLVENLAPHGVLAVQIPANRQAPLHQATTEAAAETWPEETQGCADLLHYHEPGFYYDVLSAHGLGIDIWETTYIHVLDSHGDLIEWYKSTGMRIYLNALASETDRERFADLVLERVTPLYPETRDGKVLFPFRRIFFTAEKQP